ncbi:MAG TPA: hypothetical protein VGN15_00490 [Ktedonobacteraceae bacterium]|jgi:hypothetical protein|nr:hypothetical protein [Ktedonobacteraceae bacterium]
MDKTIFTLREAAAADRLLDEIDNSVEYIACEGGAFMWQTRDAERLIEVVTTIASAAAALQTMLIQAAGEGV